jgi:hypothetical protein
MALEGCNSLELRFSQYQNKHVILMISKTVRILKIKQPGKMTWSMSSGITVTSGGVGVLSRSS